MAKKQSYKKAKQVINKIKSKSLSNEKIDSNEIKRVVIRGCIIDEEITNNMKNVAIVQDSKCRFNGQGFDVTLNYTDLGKNSNKFYKMQVIEQTIAENDFEINSLQQKKEDIIKNDKLTKRNKELELNNIENQISSIGQKKYFVFFRWGRTGSPGQISITSCDSHDSALKLFIDKFNLKTSYGYKFIPIKFDDTQEINENLEANEETVAICKEIKSFLSLIYDIKIIDDSIKEINYDTSKLPLGCLSKEIISKGFDILNDISLILVNIDDKQKELEASKSKNKRDNSNKLNSIKHNYTKQLTTLTSEFYSIIPYNFGYNHMSNYIINNKEILEQRRNELSLLSEMQLNSKILSKVNTNNKSEGLIYKEHLENIHYDIKFINDKSLEFMFFANIVETNQVKQQNVNISLHSLYSLNKNNISVEEPEQNIIYAWYCTKIHNYAHILSEGFKINKNASVSGTNFGRGIYFYDVINKAITGNLTKNGLSILLLCEINLGKTIELTQKDPFVEEKLISKFDSVIGVGQTQCKPCLNINSILDIKGKNSLKIGEIDSQIKSGTYLPYNEYVIYDIDRVKVTFAAVVKANN